jgi:hypothetical protein
VDVQPAGAFALPRLLPSALRPARRSQDRLLGRVAALVPPLPWTREIAIAWARLQSPMQSFPVAGAAPAAEWVPHLKQSSYAVGVLESEIRATLEPLVARAGGGVNDLACTFECLCAECEQDLVHRVEEQVAGFAERYRRVAYRERLAALEAELRQRLRYIETQLGRGIRGPGAESDDSVAEVDAQSPALEWDRAGWEVVRRLQDVDRVRAARWDAE